jgi:hypothetical protein
MAKALDNFIDEHLKEIPLIKSIKRVDINKD